jgi:hypothetical protein
MEFYGVLWSSMEFYGVLRSFNELELHYRTPTPLLSSTTSCVTMHETLRVAVVQSLAMVQIPSDPQKEPRGCRAFFRCLYFHRSMMMIDNYVNGLV